MNKKYLILSFAFVTLANQVSAQELAIQPPTTTSQAAVSSSAETIPTLAPTMLTPTMPTPTMPTSTVAPIPALTPSDQVYNELKSLPNVDVKEYSVKGLSPEEISKQIELLGPSDRSGAHLDALTTWNISWNWPAGERGGNFAQTTVTYTISVTIPRWEKPINPDPLTVQRWEAYRLALLQHELQRAQVITQNAPTIADEIKRAAASAPRFAAQDANATANRVMRDINSREEALNRASTTTNIRAKLLSDPRT